MKATSSRLWLRHEDLHLTRSCPFRVKLGDYAATGRLPYLSIHQELELGIALRGRVWRRFGDIERLCAPGDFWFCGMWEPHGFRVDSAPCETVVLMMTPSIVSELSLPEAPGVAWAMPFTAPQPERPAPDESLRPRVLDLAHRMRDCYAGGGASWMPRMRLLLMEFLLLVLEKHGAEQPARLAMSEAHRRIVPALELVTRSRRLVTNEEGAEACGMSRSTFVRHFSRLVGVSYARFGLRQRFGKAASELVETNRPIKAIAADWGFTDQSHFHRVFRQFAGCSPRAYRDRHRHGVASPP
jgi:AraC-like DNA-binding protein